MHALTSCREKRARCISHQDGRNLHIVLINARPHLPEERILVFCDRVIETTTRSASLRQCTRKSSVGAGCRV